ncbi:hypothetical protein GOA89_25560 [Sinorhizobium meliloti]|nr:hypothetical protein [Sinorhizobium meliloti]MDW9849612.1 hypothetical protein [Sinorhizobium meliloti]MDX0146459.1 hypothetical protein [Sinorhizobium meliloti]MDX0152637.1 hypothetical protein [Sinorhizobium meliloti]MDX0171536.1 hypothetical protein [Sinorhizobium meliloti]
MLRLNDSEGGSPAVNSAIETSPGDVRLVAHSLGCVLGANLTNHRLASLVRGAILVAPCDLAATEQLHRRVINFGRMPRSRLPFRASSSEVSTIPTCRWKLRFKASCWGSKLVGGPSTSTSLVTAGVGKSDPRC